MMVPVPYIDSSSQLLIVQGIDTPSKKTTELLDFPRELRDEIYRGYFTHQKDISFVHSDTRNCRCYACRENPYLRDRHTFPILLTCQQILREFQDLLIRKGMYLHFDCILLMKRFFDCKYLVHLKANVSSLCFNWRGGSETCVTAAHAIIGLQTLPSLRHLSIFISPSVPMRARHKYITKKMKHDGGQDVIFRIMDVIGFDELCSIRGLLGHVIVRLDENWNQFTGWPKMLDLPATGHYLRQQEEALSRYLSMLMTKKKPLDYDSKKKLRVPYYAWSDDYDIQWIGWDKENQEKRLEDEELIGW